MNTPHVLIVDDDPALLRALPEALQLRLAEITVDTCESAQCALDRIAAVDYDAIVTDIKMPGMDGLALLVEIRRLRPTTPTLLITGHGEHDLAVKALRGGAYDFIQKPIEREYFVAALTRAVQVRQLSRQIDEQQTALSRYAVELERTVEERTHELREANRIKDEFLATVSHELRTPLNSILGWAHLLRSGALDSDSNSRALHTIERNTKLLAQIIEDLLDVSRIITGKLRLDVKLLDMGPVVQAALDAVRPAIEAKKINARVSIDPFAGPIAGDASRLQQIVWNLLSNAIKFTPGGGSVEIRLDRRDSSADITVSDTGEGISPAFLPYVFDRFRQADSTFARMHTGLGLGLAIVRHLVEMHGGSVSAESPGPGLGATFKVSFPLATSPELSLDSKLATEKADQNTGDYQLAGLQVMIVDDEPEAREVLVAMLRHLGAEVIAAGSVAEALSILENAPISSMPDVLISDIGMPGEDGFELIRKLRAMEPERGGSTPAIALTAYARAEDCASVLAAGFQRHVAKPVEPSELATMIANVARRAALAS
ncbi:MAG TPA: response regulator [Blastocatellia bacterium]|nr:response regulator [Blastocatellia bacterium]